jgi:hypothetical protein
MNPREPIVDRESIRDSVAHLGHDLGDLFRAELGLFKREARQELQKVFAAGVWLAAGAILGLAALGAFTALAIILLSLVLVPWLATLIVTAACGFAALSLLAAARIKLRSALPVEFDQTARSVKEDIEWVKSGARSGR